MRLLSILLFLPIVGALIVSVFPSKSATTPRWIAAVITAIVLGVSAFITVSYSTVIGGLQFVERYEWLRIPTQPAFNVNYSVGVDGLSAPMVLLAGLLFFLAVILSWTRTLRTREYFAALLALQTGVLGVFLAQDFFLFFLFWELELFPVYILIGIWGGPKRAYAAMKFLIYTLLGSAFMLIGILYLYYTVGQSTFELSVLAAQARSLNVGFQSLIFLLLFVAFAVKLPLVPLHTWLPDAYGEASTPVSFILAGIVSKLGAYAILRISLTLLPEVAHLYAPVLAILAVVNIIYGGVIAIMQTDLKRLVAYSSISHMGYILLGAAALNEIGLSGAIFQMVSHALITALLFAAVGIVKTRTDSTAIPAPGEAITPMALQGIANSMPILATIMMIAGLASLGLPLLAGFNAEFLIFLGSFQASWPTAVVGAFGVVLSAGYVLFMYRRVFFGEATDRTRNLQDVTVIEAVPLFTLITAIVALGVFPWLITPMIQSGVAPILSQLAGR